MADCPTAWTYSASESQHLESRFGSPIKPPGCVWSTSWSVLLPLAEIAAAREAFVCVTSPPPPLLSIRTGAFVFDAPYCVESASDRAPCSLFDSCPAAWT